MDCEKANLKLLHRLVFHVLSFRGRGVGHVPIGHICKLLLLPVYSVFYKRLDWFSDGRKMLLDGAILRNEISNQRSQNRMPGTYFIGCVERVDGISYCAFEVFFISIQFRANKNPSREQCNDRENRRLNFQWCPIWKIHLSALISDPFSRSFRPLHSGISVDMAKNVSLLITLFTFASKN